MKKVIFILIILVSVIRADNVYLRNGSVYKNCKLVGTNKGVVEAEL